MSVDTEKAVLIPEGGSIPIIPGVQPKKCVFARVSILMTNELRKAKDLPAPNVIFYGEPRAVELKIQQLVNRTMTSLLEDPKKV